MYNKHTGGETTGGNMSRAEKRREGRYLWWKNDGREYVLGGKTTEGNMSGRVFFRIPH